MAFSSEPPRISPIRRMPSNPARNRKSAPAPAPAECRAPRASRLPGADRRIGVVHVATHPEFVAGYIPMRRSPSENSSGLTTFRYRRRRAAAGSRLVEHLDERLRRAIEDRQFQRVQLDVDVVHAAGIERREQMLGRGKQHAFFHQARGVADSSDVADVRFDLELSRSTRRNTIPVSAGAGTRRSRDFTAV